jgi:hypothetical protein
MRSIAASTSYTQAAGTARPQPRSLSSRTMLLIAALVLIVALASLYPSWPEGPALPGLGMNGPLQAPPQDVRLPVSACSRPGASWRGVRLLEAPGL